MEKTTFQKIYVINNYFNLIKIAIASNTSKIPITINIMHNILDKPKSELDAFEILLTVDTLFEVVLFFEEFVLVFEELESEESLEEFELLEDAFKSISISLSAKTVILKVHNIAKIKIKKILFFVISVTSNLFYIININFFIYNTQK